MIHARTQKSKLAHPTARRISVARKGNERKVTQQHPGRGVHTARQAALPHADSLSERTSNNDPSILSSDYHEGEERAPALLDPTSSNLSAPPPLAPHLATQSVTGLQHLESDMNVEPYRRQECAHALSAPTSDDPATLMSDCLLSSPPILPPHLATQPEISARHLECGVDEARHEGQQRACGLSVLMSDGPAISIRGLHCRESKEPAAALDCASDAARKSSSSSSSSSTPPPPLGLSRTALIGSSFLPSPPPTLLRSLSTSPSDEPVILSDTRNKSIPAATAPPRTTTYSPSWSSARTASSRAVEATFCKDRRKTRGRGHRTIAPTLFCCSRTLVLAVPLLVLATLASVRRPGASWRALGGVGAEFAPRNREELQGDGGAEKGVFGCVGACGRSLSVDGAGSTYCSNGAWTSGNGVCANADSDVPSDQGTGKYGAIESWDVSRVQSMRNSECVCVMCLLKRVFGLRCAAGVPCCSPHRPSAASARELCVLPAAAVSISRPPPPFRVLCPLVQGVCSCDLTLSLVSFVCFFPLY